MDYSNSEKDSKSGKGFKKIFKNFSFLTLGRVAGDFFSFLLFVVLSREFGQEGIGQYSFAVGFTGFFGMLSQFGLIDYTIKEISRNKDSFHFYFSNIFTLNLILSIFIFVILLIITPFLSFSGETKSIIIIIGGYQIVSYMINILTGIFIAYEQMHIAGTIVFTTKLLAALGSIIVTLLGGSIVFALTFLPFVTIIQFLIVLIFIKNRFHTFKLSYSFISIKKTFKELIPYGVADFLNQVYSRLDVVLIGFIIGEAATGIYNVGYRVIFFLTFIPNFSGLAIFPLITRLHRESRHEFHKMYHKSLNMMIITGLPISVGLWLIAPQAMDLIFGAKFTASVTILRILSGMFLLKCLIAIMQVFLMASDHQRYIALSNWIITILSVIIFPILIYYFGIEGAATAVMISTVLIVVLFTLKLKDIIGFPNIKSRFLICLTGISAFCVPFSFAPSLSFFLVIPLSIIIYVSVILMFKDVRENELRLALSLVKLK